MTLGQREGQTKIEATCEICGRRFWRWRSQVAHRGEAKFCSRACKDTKRGKPFTCRQCGVVVRKPPHVVNHPGRGKYCSRECLLAHKRGDGTTKVELTCSHCGVSFWRFKAWARKNSGPVCCSRTCSAEARQRGPALPRRGRVWRELAETIRERDGRRCVRCGTPEEPGQAGRLQVDHVMPARMLLDRPEVADDPLNLASLCAACHAIKTHRYEPRILRGDWLALQEFYGREIASAVTALVNA